MKKLVLLLFLFSCQQSSTTNNLLKSEKPNQELPAFKKFLYTFYRSHSNFDRDTPVNQGVNDSLKVLYQLKLGSLINSMPLTLFRVNKFDSKNLALHFQLNESEINNGDSTIMIEADIFGLLPISYLNHLKEGTVYNINGKFIQYLDNDGYRHYTNGLAYTNQIAMTKNFNSDIEITLGLMLIKIDATSIKEYSVHDNFVKL